METDPTTPKRRGRPPKVRVEAPPAPARGQAPPPPALPAYHLKAISEGQPMFGPSDLDTGAYAGWLAARRAEGDRKIEAFVLRMREMSAEWKLGDRWMLDPTGQQEAMLAYFSFPPPIQATMLKRLGLSGLQPAPVELPKDTGMLVRAETA